MIKCELCSKEFKQITKKHLAVKHEMSLRTYKNTFPNSLISDPIVTEFKRKSASKRFKDLWENRREDMIKRVWSTERKRNVRISILRKKLRKVVDELKALGVFPYEDLTNV